MSGNRWQSPQHPAVRRKSAWTNTPANHAVAPTPPFSHSGLVAMSSTTTVFRVNAAVPHEPVFRDFSPYINRRAMLSLGRLGAAPCRRQPAIQQDRGKFFFQVRFGELQQHLEGLLKRRILAINSTPAAGPPASPPPPPSHRSCSRCEEKPDGQEQQRCRYPMNKTFVTLKVRDALGVRQPPIHQPIGSHNPHHPRRARRSKQSRLPPF